MKRTRSPMQVWDQSHALASKLSNDYGVSMAAVVDFALRTLAKANPKEITFAKKMWWRKHNARTALKARAG